MIALFVSLIALGALLALVVEHVWLDEVWQERLSHVIPDIHRG
ncbi:hypothetical protein [Paludibacterium sp.]|nr:hypothetical protein [Paludibacterium sp.]